MIKNDKIISFITLLLFTLTNISVIKPINVQACETVPGKITLDKYRSAYELKPGESTDVTLKVTANPVEIKTKKDVVITIDVSNSMVNNKDGEKSVMQSTINAAKTLVANILNDGSGSRVALVRYGSIASAYNFTDSSWVALNDSGSVEDLTSSNVYAADLDIVKNVIDNIKSHPSMGNIKSNDRWAEKPDEGATNTEAGLLVTKIISEKHVNANYVVFMSDGVPTARQIGHDNNASGLYGATYDRLGNYTSEAEKNEAISAGSDVKNGATVYSVAITLGLTNNQKAISNEVMSAAASDSSRYFSTSNPGAEINKIYQEIGTSIVNTIAKNGLVTDIVPKYFTVSNLPAGLTETSLADGSTQLSWNIGDIIAGENTVTYTVTLKPGYYGIVDTNASAVLSYTDHVLGSNDPNTASEKTFPVPEIKAQLSADNDEYTASNNTDPYLITSDNSILKNDVNEKMDNAPYDSRTGNNFTPTNDRSVSDYKIVITQPLSAGDGTISDFNYTNGTFTYTPNSNKQADTGADSYTVYFKYKLVSNDSNNAYVSNEATVNITVPVPACAPSIKITKSVNPTETYPGQTVTYTMTVTNNGNVPLTGVMVTDPLLPDLNGSIDNLAVNETKTVTGTYTVPSNEAPGTQINNTATAAGYYGEQKVSNTAAAVLKIVPVPAPKLKITKSVDPTKAYPGQIVTYTMAVTNTGNVPLTGVKVTDSMLSDFNGTMGNLAVNETKTVLGTYTVPSDAVPGTPINNTAAAVGYYGKQEVNDTEAAVLNIIPIPAPSLNITKTVNPTEAYPGQTVTYTMAVTNTGNVPLTGVIVTDPLLPDLNGTIGNLAVNETKTVTGTYTVSSNAVPGTPINNTAAAVGYYGEQEVNGTAAVVLNIIPIPVSSLKITKSVNQPEAYPGQKVTYTMVVKNTGSVALTDVKVSDPMLTGFNGTIGNLAVNESKTLTSDYIIPASAAIGSPLNNTATVTGNYGDKAVSDTSSASLNIVPVPNPTIDITKSVNKTEAYSGQKVTYTMVVKNTGNVALTDVLVTDLMLTGFNGTIGNLAVNESKTLTADYIIPASAAIGSPLNNTATVTGNYGDKAVSDTSSASLNIVPVPNPTIDITKSVNKTEAYSGQKVTYTMVVKNTGNVALTDVLVTDLMLTGFNGTIGNLAVNESKTLKADYIIPASAAIGSPLSNTATVTGNYGDKTVSDTSYASLNVIEVPVPGLSIAKTANVLSAKIGDTIKYTITVTNTGNMDLQNVSVSDLMLGFNKNITLLAKGSSESFTENYVVPENTPAGNLTNTAEAVYGNITVSSKVDVNILEKIDDDNPPYGGGVPGIKVIKTVDKTTAKIGDTVKYTITIINTGTVDLKNVLITDKMLGINYTIDFIKEGDNKKIIKEYVIPENIALGNLVNIAEASVTYNDEEITASGSAVTKIVEAAVNIDDDDVPEGGTTLPKTGGIPFSDFIVLGLGVTLLGLIFIKKK